MAKVYLDNAATTPVRKEVVECMHEALSQCFGNPSSSHGFGRTAKSGVEHARKTIAKTLNAQPSEIIFTSGGTEADNMILRCAVRDLDVKTIITSPIEHHAVLHTIEDLKKEYGIQVIYLNVNSTGSIELSELEEALQNNSAVLVSLMHINNEIGNKLDIEAVALLCKLYDALFHSDTVQSIGHYSWDLEKIPIDFLNAAAHKFHGPKGIGFAFIRKNSGIKPLIVGGAQERGYRAGTEPYHNIVGLESAFKAAYDNLEEEATYVKGLKAHFVREIKEAIPEVAFNGLSGDLDKSTYTLVNLRLPIPEAKALMLLFHLDLKGIACSKGSACQSGSNKGSHVLSQILTDEELDTPSLRFSFSKYNTIEELDYTIGVLKDFVES
ncbi:MAG: cysteine desulfurase [Eudoraea sp.]|nr:cysteine desulfurase [Eudoraea sp.]